MRPDAATAAATAQKQGRRQSKITQHYKFEGEVDDQDDMAARAGEVSRLIEQEQARGGGDFVHSSDADSDGCVPMKALVPKKQPAA